MPSTPRREDYQKLRPLSPPAGYVFVLEDVGYKRFRIGWSSDPRQDIDRLRAEFPFETRVAHLERSDDARLLAQEMQWDAAPDVALGDWFDEQKALDDAAPQEPPPPTVPEPSAVSLRDLATGNRPPPPAPAPRPVARRRAAAAETRPTGRRGTRGVRLVAFAIIGVMLIGALDQALDLRALFSSSRQAPQPRQSVRRFATSTPRPTVTKRPTRKPSATPLPPIVKSTAVPPTATFTSLPPTATFTSLPPTATITAVPPTATTTAIPPTATNTTIPPTATKTMTAIPPTATDTSIPRTATNTDSPPTATFTAIPPTATNTAIPPTATETALPPTLTSTSLPPTATNTAIPPTATDTSLPPTATNTAIPPTATNTPAPSPTPMPQFVAMQRANVRGCPAISCALVDVLETGETISAIAIVAGERVFGSVDWIEFSVGASSGFAHGGAFRDAANALEFTIVTRGDVHAMARACPRTDCAVVDRLPANRLVRGSPVAGQAINGDLRWIRIARESGDAFVHASLLRERR